MGRSYRQRTFRNDSLSVYHIVVTYPVCGHTQAMVVDLKDFASYEVNSDDTYQALTPLCFNCRNGGYSGKQQ